MNTICLRTAALLGLALAALLLSGCVSMRYRMAPQGTPPPVPLHLAAAQPPVEAVLNTVIIYDGPGSWKRRAFWDEYVITIHNQGEQPVTILSALLTDYADNVHSPGIDPWALEQESKTLEQKFRDDNVAFLRYGGASVAILGVGMGSAVAADGGIMAAGTAAGATLATATLVAVPAYVITVAVINSRNKAAVTAEFNRRRLPDFPLVLAPGETRSGSLFFPMVPNPRSLRLLWTIGETGGSVVLPLESLHGLHVKAPASAAR